MLLLPSACFVGTLPVQPACTATACPAAFLVLPLPAWPVCSGPHLLTLITAHAPKFMPVHARGACSCLLLPCLPQELSTLERLLGSHHPRVQQLQEDVTAQQQQQLQGTTFQAPAHPSPSQPYPIHFQQPISSPTSASPPHADYCTSSAHTRASGPVSDHWATASTPSTHAVWSRAGTPRAPTSRRTSGQEAVPGLGRPLSARVTPSPRTYLGSIFSHRCCHTCITPSAHHSSAHHSSAGHSSAHHSLAGHSSAHHSLADHSSANHSSRAQPTPLSLVTLHFISDNTLSQH